MNKNYFYTISIIIVIILLGANIFFFFQEKKITPYEEEKQLPNYEAQISELQSNSINTPSPQPATNTQPTKSDTNTEKIVYQDSNKKTPCPNPLYF